MNIGTATLPPCVLAAVRPLAVMIVLAGCGGPDFTAATVPRGDDAGVDAGDDVDNTPIILPPDKAGTTGQGDDGGDATMDVSIAEATTEGSTSNAWGDSGESLEGTRRRMAAMRPQGMRVRE